MTGLRIGMFNWPLAILPLAMPIWLVLPLPLVPIWRLLSRRKSLNHPRAIVESTQSSAWRARAGEHAESDGASGDGAHCQCTTALG